MCRQMFHRGPDDEGFFSDASATLGMRRLAIFDPANGRQPMSTPDGRIHLIFNGALYNFRELRSELSAIGANFHTECDTEVLLAAYAHWGEDCLKRFRGMFAFAAWDTHNRSLFLARDPFGIKPLYVSSHPDRLLFASELNALLASGFCPAEIDPAAVSNAVAYLAPPAPQTIYRNIVSLRPGECATWRGGTLNVRTYWTFLDASSATAPACRSRPEFIAQLRERLDDSILAHSLADVPVGAFLSGGLDSSAVVGLMARQSGTKLKTFSIGFDQAAYSEASEAAATARHIGTDHTSFILTGERVASDLDAILASYDQPTGDAVNTYYVSHVARAGGVTAALSGLGGDELFGSYPSFRDLPRLQRLLPWWRRLPPGTRRWLIAQLRAQPQAQARKLADFLAHARDLHELASLQRRVLPEESRQALLAPEARALAVRLGPHHPMLEAFAFDLAGADDFQIVSAWELRTYMANVLLRDSDVMSMAHSLELRVPFVDTRLLEWLWPQPAHFKRDPRTPKRALADAVANVVPGFIRQRPKQGFTLPFPLWMRQELRPFLEETFSAPALARCPWLDAPAVITLWTQFQQGQDNRAWSRVWTVAMLIAFANRPVES